MLNTKFKVGDKVTLKPVKPEWANTPPFYTDEMVDHCESGRIFTIYRVGHSYIDLGLWSAKEEWIEHAQVSLDNV